MGTPKRDARARRRLRRGRRAALAGLGVAAGGLVALGVLLPTGPGGTPTAVDPAAAAVDGPSTMTTLGGTGSGSGQAPGSSNMIVPVPVGPALPTFVVPRPQVVPLYVPPFVPRGVSPRLSPPTAACGGYGSPRHIVPGVTAGTGQATVSWRADGNSDVTGYRVQAVSQRLVGGTQPAPVVQTAGQPAGCVPVSATVTGLSSGVPYVFWLEEAQYDKASGVTRYVQVGTSDAVVIG